MPLMDHFAELRRRIIVVIVFLFGATIVLYEFTPQIIDFLIQPVSEYLPTVGGNQLNVLDPLQGFTLRFKVAFVASIIVTSPIWIWNILAFFLPALKKNERKWVLPTFFVGLALFIIGNVFCYLFILSPAFGWLLGQAADFATVFPDADTYINVILTFELAFGIAFELPLVVFYLVAFEVIPYKKLRESWRVIYIVIMFAAATITPDASPVPMLMLFAAMISLYEVSLGMARLVLRKRIERQAAEEGLDIEAAEAAIGISKRSKRKSKRKSDGKSENNSDSKSKRKQDGKSENNSDSKAESESESKSDSKAEK
jgi:sec-independent protein translocase protein TatC